MIPTNKFRKPFAGSNSPAAYPTSRRRRTGGCHGEPGRSSTESLPRRLNDWARRWTRMMQVSTAVVKQCSTRAVSKGGWLAETWVVYHAWGTAGLTALILLSAEPRGRSRPLLLLLDHAHVNESLR